MIPLSLQKKLLSTKYVISTLALGVSVLSVSVYTLFKIYKNSETFVGSGSGFGSGSARSYTVALTNASAPSPTCKNPAHTFKSGKCYIDPNAVSTPIPSMDPMFACSNGRNLIGRKCFAQNSVTIAESAQIICQCPASHSLLLPTPAGIAPNPGVCPNLCYNTSNNAPIPTIKEPSFRCEPGYTMKNYMCYKNDSRGESYNSETKAARLTCPNPVFPNLVGNKCYPVAPKDDPSVNRCNLNDTLRSTADRANIIRDGIVDNSDKCSYKNARCFVFQGRKEFWDALPAWSDINTRGADAAIPATTKALYDHQESHIRCPTGINPWADVGDPYLLTYYDSVDDGAKAIIPTCNPNTFFCDQDSTSSWKTYTQTGNVTPLETRVANALLYNRYNAELFFRWLDEAVPASSYVRSYTKRLANLLGMNTQTSVANVTNFNTIKRNMKVCGGTEFTGNYCKDSAGNAQQYSGYVCASYLPGASPGVIQTTADYDIYRRKVRHGDPVFYKPDPRQWKCMVANKCANGYRFVTMDGLSLSDRKFLQVRNNAIYGTNYSEATDWFSGAGGGGAGGDHATTHFYSVKTEREKYLGGAIVANVTKMVKYGYGVCLPNAIDAVGECDTGYEIHRNQTCIKSTCDPGYRRWGTNAANNTLSIVPQNTIRYVWETLKDLTNSNIDTLLNIWINTPSSITSINTGTQEIPLGSPQRNAIPGELKRIILAGAAKAPNAPTVINNTVGMKRYGTKPPEAIRYGMNSTGYWTYLAQVYGQLWFQRPPRASTATNSVDDALQVAGTAPLSWTNTAPMMPEPYLAAAINETGGDVRSLGNASNIVNSPLALSFAAAAERVDFYNTTEIVDVNAFFADPVPTGTVGPPGLPIFCVADVTPAIPCDTGFMFNEGGNPKWAGKCHLQQCPVGFSETNGTECTAISKIPELVCPPNFFLSIDKVICHKRCGPGYNFDAFRKLCTPVDSGDAQPSCTVSRYQLTSDKQKCVGLCDANKLPSADGTSVNEMCVPVTFPSITQECPNRQLPSDGKCITECKAGESQVGTTCHISTVSGCLANNTLCKDPNTYCLTNEYALTTNDFDQTIRFNIQGRFVKVFAPPADGTNNSDRYFSLSQIIVMDMNGNNIALNKPTYASSTFPGTSPSSTVVDGTVLPRKYPNIWTNNLPDDPSDFWQVDLGSIQMISTIRYISRSDSNDTSNPDTTPRNKGIRIRVYQGQLDTISPIGMCITPPPLLYPAGSTPAEQLIIKNIIVNGGNGQIALTIFRAILANTLNAEFTTYGLTDAQAANAYAVIRISNVNSIYNGVKFVASWANNSTTLTFISGTMPAISNPNDSIVNTSGMPAYTLINSINGNTITIDTPTSAASTSSTVTTQGDTTQYRRELNAMQRVMKMSDITFDKALEIRKFLQFNTPKTSGISTGLGGSRSGSQDRIDLENQAKIYAAQALLTYIMNDSAPIKFDPASVYSTVPTHTVRQTDTSLWAQNAIKYITDGFTNMSENFTGSGSGIINDIQSGSMIDEYGVVKYLRGGTTTFSSQPLPPNAFNNALNKLKEAVNYTPLVGSLSLVNSQVFQVDGIFNDKASATAACSQYGATLATIAQLNDAYNNGAEWCKPGWTKDKNNTTDSDQTLYFPQQGGCSSSTNWKPIGTVDLLRPGAVAPAGETAVANTNTKPANCYGVKPAKDTPNIVPWYKTSWSMPRAIPEVYSVGGNTEYRTVQDAEAACKALNGTLATGAQLNDAKTAGAQWCACGWISDTVGQLTNSLEVAARIAQDQTGYVLALSTTEGSGINAAAISAAAAKRDAAISKLAELEAAVPRIATSKSTLDAAVLALTRLTTEANAAEAAITTARTALTAAQTTAANTVNKQAALTAAQSAFTTAQTTYNTANTAVNTASTNHQTAVNLVNTRLTEVQAAQSQYNLALAANIPIFSTVCDWSNTLWGWPSYSCRTVTTYPGQGLVDSTSSALNSAQTALTSAISSRDTLNTTLTTARATLTTATAPYNTALTALTAAQTAQNPYIIAQNAVTSAQSAVTAALAADTRAKAALAAAVTGRDTALSNYNAIISTSAICPNNNSLSTDRNTCIGNTISNPSKSKCPIGTTPVDSTNSQCKYADVISSIGNAKAIRDAAIAEIASLNPIVQGSKAITDTNTALSLQSNLGSNSLKTCFYPMQEMKPGCGTNKMVNENINPSFGGAAANCYGIKPPEVFKDTKKIRPFSDAVANARWSQNDLLQAEVYFLGKTKNMPANTNDFQTPEDAQAACVALGGTLATLDQLTVAQSAGAQWCNPGWISNNNYLHWPSQEVICGTVGINSKEEEQRARAAVPAAAAASTAAAAAAAADAEQVAQLEATLAAEISSYLQQEIRQNLAAARTRAAASAGVAATAAAALAAVESRSGSGSVISGGATCYGIRPTITTVNTNTPPASGTPSGVGKLFILLDANTNPTTTINMLGRYIRIRASGSTQDNLYINLSQVIVKNMNGNIISNGRKTYATSTSSVAPASIAVDGTTTKRPAASIWSNKGLVDDYWEVDLGSQQQISTVTIYGPSDFYIARMAGIKLEIAQTPTIAPFSNISAGTRISQNMPLNTVPCMAGFNMDACY